MGKYPACLEHTNRFKIDDFGNLVKIPKMYHTSRLHSNNKCIKSGEMVWSFHVCSPLYPLSSSNISRTRSYFLPLFVYSWQIMDGNAVEGNIYSIQYPCFKDNLNGSSCHTQLYLRQHILMLKNGLIQNLRLKIQQRVY